MGFGRCRRRIRIIRRRMLQVCTKVDVFVCVYVYVGRERVAGGMRIQAPAKKFIHFHIFTHSPIPTHTPTHKHTHTHRRCPLLAWIHLDQHQLPGPPCPLAAQPCRRALPSHSHRDLQLAPGEPFEHHLGAICKDGILLGTV